MFKSLFAKTYALISTVTICSLLVLGGILLIFVENYATTEKEMLMHQNGEKIAEMTTGVSNNFSPLLERYYVTTLELFAEISNSDILVVNQGGAVLASTENFKKRSIVVSKDVMNTLARDKYFKEIGTFNGTFNTTYLTVGVPIMTNGTVVGGVFLSSTTEEMTKLRRDIFGMFTPSAAAVLILSFLIVYFVTHQMVKPLKTMSRAAKSFAMGSFETRIPVNGEDEISDLAESFNQMADALARTEQSRSSFIANISHELKTPMTTISGFVNGILDGTIDQESQGKYLKIVSDEMKRLSRLVNSLLELSRLEGDQGSMVTTVFDICELTKRVLLGFERQVEAKNLHVNVNFFKEKIDIVADYDSIYQVVFNLTDNAIKYANEGGLIEIDVIPQDDKINISITNSGYGIPEEARPLVFERFYKTDTSRGIDKKGLGLGLYIVKMILQRHGERIWVDSKANEYTTFTFTLSTVKAKEKAKERDKDRDRENNRNAVAEKGGDDEIESL